MSCMNPEGIELHWPLTDNEVFDKDGKGHLLMTCQGCGHTERVDFQMPPRDDERWNGMVGDFTLVSEIAAFQISHLICGEIE